MAVLLIKRYKLGGVAEEIGQLRTAFPDQHPLAGMRVKLERAREHLVTLNGAVSAFLERNPYELIEEHRRGGRELIIKVRVHETPPLAWSGVIGDCVQNMRAALEYLAWELAGLDAPGDPPSYTGFPIYLESRRYHATRRDGTPEPWSGLKKVERIGGEAQLEIEASQPFNDRATVLPGTSPWVVPHEATQQGWRVIWQRHPLWKLEELAKPDRHTALRLIGVPKMSYGTANPSGSPQPKQVRYFRRDPVVDGAILTRYVFREPGAKMRTTGLTIRLQLQDQGEPRSWSVISALGDMLDHIDAKVVPRFERFF